MEEPHAASAWTPGRNIDARVQSAARSRLSGECLFRLLPARAISTPAAGVGGFSLLAVLVYVADEYPAIYARAGAQALEGGVVSIYGVVVILGRGARRVR